MSKQKKRKNTKYRRKHEIQDKKNDNHNAPALEACLAEAFVQALAKRTSRDLRVKLAAQSRVAVTLECCIWPTAAREEVRGD